MDSYSEHILNETRVLIDNIMQVEKIPKVYIDTNIFKFSATKLPRLIPRVQKTNLAGVEQEIIIHDFIDVDPNENISNTVLKDEARLLSELSSLGDQGLVRFLIQMETELESWGLPNMDSKSGKFYGVHLEKVDAPVVYGRVIAGGFESPEERQFKFLSGLKHKRFIELQKLTGAYQGKQKTNRNQLLDAFHIWCAEHNECDYFLTMDFKLIKVVSQSKRINLGVKLVRPSELLAQLKNSTK